MHYRGKEGEKKFELCLASQYFRGKTFEEINAILKDPEAKCHIPSCLSNGAVAKECKHLRNRIFKYDDCSKRVCWDGPIRYTHVKKHVNDPRDPQT